MSTVGLAQDASNVAVAQGHTELIKAKESGVFTFEIPGDKTSEEVSDRAKFYTNYFTVAFDEGTDIVTITMVDNSPSSRTIISRFLMSSGFRMVRVGDEELKMIDFTAQYLK